MPTHVVYKTSPPRNNLPVKRNNIIPITNQSRKKKRKKKKINDRVKRTIEGGFAFHSVLRNALEKKKKKKSFAKMKFMWCENMWGRKNGKQKGHGDIPSLKFVSPFMHYQI